jgi:hypothetical protein
MGRGNIRNIVSALHDIVGEDTMRSMESVKQLMDQAGRSGMLTGITDANQFKQRFGRIVKQVQAVAEVMGTSLEQAMPMFQQMQQMGVWQVGDILGTAAQGRVAGAAAPQMMQTMATGAQMAHAMGGQMRAGAMTGRLAFGQIQAAQRAGTLSQEDIMEFTGGLQGAAGQQAVAQRMTAMMTRFGETGAGRLMMAGLGQTEEGRFTGQIDPEKLERFQRGEISFGQLQGMGQRAAGTQTGAMSFHRQAGRIGQNLAAEGGLEAVFGAVEKVASRFAREGTPRFEEARHQLFQQMLKVSNREAEMLGRLADDMPRIMDEHARATEAAVEAQFREVHERRNRSFAGLGQAFSHAFGEAMRPLQEFGADVSTEIGQATDRITDRIQGRVRGTPMGSAERGRLLRGGAMERMDFGALEDTSDILQRGGVGGAIEGITGRLRRGGLGGVLGDVGGGMALGAGMGFALPIPGAALVGGVAGGVGGLLSGEDTRQQTLRDIGIEDPGSATRTEIRAASRAAFQRAAGGVDVRQFKGDKLAKAQAALMKVVGQEFTDLRDLKEKDPFAYGRELLKRVKRSDPAAFEGLSGPQQMSLLAAAQEKTGFAGGAVGVDWTRVAEEIPSMAMTPDAIKKRQNEALDAFVESTKVVKAGHGGGLIGVGGLHVTPGVERELAERVLTGAHADKVQQFLSGEMGDEEFNRLAGMAGNEDLAEFASVLKRDPSLRAGMAKTVTQYLGARGQEAGMKAFERIRDIASKAQTAKQIGLRGEAAAQYGEMIEAYQRQGGFGEAIRTANQMAATASDRELRLLQRGGAFGKQVSALSQIGRIQEMGAGEARSLLRRLEKTTGYGLRGLGEEERGRIEEDITSRGGLDMEEAANLRQMLKKQAETQISETRESRKGFTQTLMEQLNTFSKNSADFAIALKDIKPLLGKPKKVDPASAEAEKD